MIDPTALLQFPVWLRNAVESGHSTVQLARLLGTTPAAITGIVGSVPTRPAEVRRLARRLVVLKDMAGAGGRRRRNKVSGR